MLNYRKKLLIIFGLIILLTCIIPQVALAQNSVGAKIFSTLEKVGGSQGAGFNTSASSGDNVPLIIGGIIKIILSFLGIIFFIFVLYGGFLWMTAGGKEDQVTKAIDMVKNASIGLIIIVVAYALSAFIMDAVIEASDPGSI